MNSQIERRHFAKSNFLYMRKYLHADLITHIPPYRVGLVGREVRASAFWWKSRGCWTKSCPELGLLQQQEVSMGPCRACAVSSTVSLCGKSAEATTKPIIETRDQEQQAPSPLYSYRRLHTALPRPLSWPGPSHIHCTEQELESGNQICYWRGEEEQLERKQWRA